MRRRVLVVSLASIVVLMAIVIFAGVQIAKARTINVDDDGGKDYTKIQDAVNASSKGDTVYVYNGAYNESIVVNKTISLVGESNQSTIIKGTRTSDSKGVHILANYVNVSSIKVDKFEYGICLDSTSNNNAIVSNTITNCFCGIDTLSSNNTVASNTITQCDFGISIKYSSNNIIASNAIAQGIWGGVYASYSSNNSIVSNNIANGGMSISLDSSSNFTITYNTISKCGIGVALCSGSDNNTITSNTITDCTLLKGRSCGIFLGDSSNNTVASNMISNCDNGTLLGNASNNNIAFNSFENCRWFGISLNSSSNNNQISSNTFLNCGIFVSSFETNTIQNNTLSGYNAAITTDKSKEDKKGFIPFLDFNPIIICIFILAVIVGSRKRK